MVLVVKDPPANPGDLRELGLNPGSPRSSFHKVELIVCRQPILSTSYLDLNYLILLSKHLELSNPIQHKTKEILSVKYK